MPGYTGSPSRQEFATYRRPRRADRRERKRRGVTSTASWRQLTWQSGRSPGNARSRSAPGQLMFGASASSRSVTFSSLAPAFPRRRLALLPLAVLVPDRPPAALLLPGRVHRNPALQLDHGAAALVAACPVPLARTLPRAMRPAFARPAEDLRPRCAPVVGISWGSWPTRALPAHGDSLASCVVAGREGGSTVLSVLFPC